MTSINGFASQFRLVVPQQFWKADEHGGSVDCPCGERMRFALASTHQCTCDRFYLYTGTALRVANSPKLRVVVDTA